jgi:type I restriction enzyme S subunit
MGMERGVRRDRKGAGRPAAVATVESTGLAPVEGPWELPDGWRWARLRDVATLNPRIAIDHLASDTTVAFVPMAAVSEESGAVDVSRTKPLDQVRTGYTRFAPGDVLFAKITPCMENGKIAILPPVSNDIAFGSTEFHVLRPQAVSSRYLWYFLLRKAFRSDAEHNMSGAVGQKRVPTAFLADAMIPIAPADVQERIVAKVDALFAEIDEAEVALDDAGKGLDVFRKSLLKAAVTGEMTRPWREANPVKDTGAGLLAQVLSERQGRWQADPKNFKKKYVAPVPPDTTGLPEIPREWTWASIDQLTRFADYGTSKKCGRDSLGVTVLRMGNIGGGTISYENLSTLKMTALFRCWW